LDAHDAQPTNKTSRCNARHSLRSASPLIASTSITGVSGTKRERPGLDQALAAVRAGDTLVVPELDRLARSVPDARDIGDTLRSESNLP
jgi:DNA invertase Pin-like site-specific DNA recombinase